MASAAGKTRWPDRIVEATLIGLLGFLAFAYGGVLASAHAAIVAAAIVIGSCFAIRCLSEPVVAWSGAFVAVFGFVVLVAAQLIPLPLDVLRVVAPGSADAWRGLTPSAPISVYPFATRRDLRLLVSVAVIVFVVVNVYDRPAKIRRLLTAVSVIGMAIVALCLLQNLTASRSILWIWPLPDAPSFTGPFVHRGHYCEFVCITMGAGLGALLMRQAERSHGDRFGIRELWDGLGSPSRRFDLALVVFLVFGFVTIAMSQSRSGLFAMLAAFVIVGAVVQRSRYLTGIGWSLTALVLVAFVVLLATGFDPVYERMSTLSDPADQLSVRAALLRDTTAAWKSAPVTGFGLGSYELGFPRFDTATRYGTAQHAENHYAEVLAETGALGLLSLMAVLAIAVAAWARVVRKHSRALAGAAFGIGFAIVAVVINEATGFGLRVPAIVLLFAVVLAGLLAPVAARGKRWVRTAQVLVFATVVGLSWLGLPGTIAAACAESHWDRVEAIQDETGLPARLGTKAQYARIRAHADRAAALQPGNIEYRFWAAMYRWYEMLADYAGRYEKRSDIPRTPELVALARETQRRLLDMRTVAPTHGPSWSLAGQLGVLWLDEPAAAEWIHEGRRLAPHHVATCLASARQLLREGRTDAAVIEFRRAIRVGASWQAVLRLLIHELDRPEVAHAVAHGQAKWLLWLSRLPLPEGVVEDVHAEAKGLLEARCARPGAPAWMLAGLGGECRRVGDFDEAVVWLRRYLRRVPGSRLRFDLARLLVSLGEEDDARLELRRLLRFHPDHDAGRELLGALSKR